MFLVGGGVLIMRCPILAISVNQAVANPGYAYIDPGTGSFLFQTFLAGLLALGASIHIFWHRIKETWQKMFHRREGRQEEGK